MSLVTWLEIILASYLIYNEYSIILQRNKYLCQVAGIKTSSLKVVNEDNRNCLIFLMMMKDLSYDYTPQLLHISYIYPSIISNTLACLVSKIDI